MAEVIKIGVVYDDQPPNLLLDEAPDGMPWSFEFFPQSSIVDTPIAPRGDLKTILISKQKLPAMASYLSRIFPTAEIVGYQDREAGESCEQVWMEAGSVIAMVPMTLAMASFLFENIAALGAAKAEQARARLHTTDVNAFFEAFVNTIESAGSSADRGQAMGRLLNKIVARLHAEEGLIYFCDEAGMPLQRAYETSHIKDLDLFDHQVNSSIVDQVLRSGMPHVDNNCRIEIKVPFSQESEFIKSILCLPLMNHGQKIGVIELLNSRAGGFSEDDRSLMETLVRPISVAIGTIRELDNAERLTATDDLTKLYNYRYLMQYLEAEVKRCLRYKKKVSLLFIDVDGFKRVNDTFGHLVGSSALAEMGQVLLKILRETDVIGRYGGDEFVVVLPETPLNGALVIAERIRKKVEDYEFIAQDLSIHLTVSLGVANCPRHTLTAEGLIKKADAAMYRAKEISKNSIKVAV